MSRRQTGKGGDFDTRPNPFKGSGPNPRTSADFTEISDLGKALQVCVEAGCAIMLGRTRDGGAVVLTILDQDERHRTYCSNNVELQNAFDAIVNMYEAM